MARLYTVRRLKIGHTDQMDALARAAGDLYSQVVLWYRKEYLGGSPVVGAMASPSGVRYHAHMRCSTLLPPSGVKESQVR